MGREYREPYPAWILIGMDVLAAGILIASFRDAWAVVKSLGAESASLTNALVAAAVVLAIDATILLLEQVRSHVKLRGGRTWISDVWVLVLIALSATLNVRYLTQTTVLADSIIGAVLGIAIPSTIAVLGYLKGDMLAFNAQVKHRIGEAEIEPALDVARATFLPMPGVASLGAAASEEPAAPLFRLKRG